MKFCLEMLTCFFNSSKWKNEKFNQKNVYSDEATFSHKQNVHAKYSTQVVATQERSQSYDD